MEWLANLSVKWVLIASGSVVALLALIRILGKERKGIGAWLDENLQVFLSVVVVVFLVIRPFLFQAFYIPSGSMEPTLLGPEEAGGTGGAGDRLLVNKLIYRFVEPKRGDIVVFNAPPKAAPPDRDNPQGKEYIKRVMGLPGETISVLPPRIMVDGQQALALTTGGAFNNNREIPGVAGDEDEPPKLSADRRTATIEILGDEPIRVVAAPTLTIRHTPKRLEVNGKVLLESPEGRIEEMKDPAAFGTAPGVKARAFVVETDFGEEEPDVLVVQGEALEYRAGQIAINGKPMERDFTPVSVDYGMAPLKLASNEFLMLGDNRANSNDGHEWGPLTRDRVIGRAEVIFWPINRVRVLEWWLLIALAVIFGGYEVLLRALRGDERRER
jgi:signal peptidase I